MGNWAEISATGVPATAAPAAPNITSATAAAVYSLWGNGTFVAFGGVITPPSSRAHLVTVSVQVALHGSSTWQEIQRVAIPASGTVAYQGGQFPQASGLWDVQFVAYNEVGAPTASPYTVSSVAVVGASVSAVSGVDASTLATGNANYHPRWQNPALHTVINATVSMSNAQYPQVVTLWMNMGSGPVWQGWWTVTGDNSVISIGLQGTNNDATYPPVTADGSWAITAAAGAIGSGAAIPSGAVTSSAFTVPAPPAPAATAATGAYVDAITYAPIGGGAYAFGWSHLYATLPLEDPNFWFARFTVQTGVVVGGVFTPGGAHPTEVGFVDWSTDSDHGVTMTRVPGTDQVYEYNANNWNVPSDGNVCHRIRLYITSRRGGPNGTTTLQQCWSSGVGVSAAGTADHQDLVVDGAKAQVLGSAIAPGTVSADKISSVNASTVTGTLTASQIASVNATAISGTITASQITSLTAGQITGQLTSSQIGSVAATTITGSIAAGQIGSVNATAITGQLTAGQIASVTAGQITGQLNASQISAVNASAISGSITSGQISSVTAGSITGVIVTAQLAAGILNAVSLFSAGLLPLQTVSGLPTLPNAGYPVGCTVSNTADGKLYRNVSNAWSSSAAASDVTGTLTASQIASVNTSSLVGLVTAGQINSIATSQLTGTINSTQISSVAATTISGSITAGQISSVYTSALSGYIYASQIWTVNATAISGTISAGQIGSVNASSVSGTLAWNQIGSINANTITVNQITAGQIASVNAGSIQAGTISASISISAPTISGGSLSGTSISISTLGGTVSINSSSYGVSVSATSSSVSGFRTSWSTYASVVMPYQVSTTDGTYTGTLNTSYIGFSGGGYSTTYGNGVVSISYGGYSTSLSYSSLSVGNVLCISGGAFVGAGVNTPSYGHAAAGFNPYVGGVQYFGATFTFYDQGGTLHTVKGGVLVS